MAGAANQPSKAARNSGRRKKPRGGRDGDHIVMNAWTVIGFGANASAIMMALAWAISRRLKNARLSGRRVVLRIFDPRLHLRAHRRGDHSRRWLIASVVTIWSLQVGTSLLLEVRRGHPAREASLCRLARTVSQTSMADAFWIFPISGGAAYISFDAFRHRVLESDSRNEPVGNRRPPPLDRRQWSGKFITKFSPIRVRCDEIRRRCLAAEFGPIAVIRIVFWSGLSGWPSSSFHLVRHGVG